MSSFRSISENLYTHPPTYHGEMFFDGMEIIALVPPDSVQYLGTVELEVRSWTDRNFVPDFAGIVLYRIDRRDPIFHSGNWYEISFTFDLITHYNSSIDFIFTHKDITIREVQ